MNVKSIRLSSFPLCAGVISLSLLLNMLSAAPASAKEKLAKTTTDLTASANPVACGQTVTYTATVTSANIARGVPTGKVRFKHGKYVFATVSLNASGHASFSTDRFSTAGFPRKILAVYDGDADFKGSLSSVLIQKVNPPIQKASMSRPQVQADKSVKVPLSGSPDQSYVLQASTDMIHWTAVSTNTTDATGLLSFLDSDAKNYPARFYRSIVQQ